MYDRRWKSRVLAGIAAGALVLMAGCSATSPGGYSFPNVVEIAGCIERDGTDSETVYSYIEYEYDGAGVLTFRHSNTVFNCCPVGWGGLVSIEGNMIVIDEVEADGQCDCLCPFDIEYRIDELVDGVYRLMINELYADTGNEAFDVILNLSGPTSGEICLERSGYPWSE